MGVAVAGAPATPPVAVEAREGAAEPKEAPCVLPAATLRVGLGPTEPPAGAVPALPADAEGPAVATVPVVPTEGMWPEESVGSMVPLPMDPAAVDLSGALPCDWCWEVDARRCAALCYTPGCDRPAEYGCRNFLFPTKWGSACCHRGHQTGCREHDGPCSEATPPDLTSEGLPPVTDSPALASTGEEASLVLAMGTAALPVAPAALPPEPEAMTEADQGVAARQTPIRGQHRKPA